MKTINTIKKVTLATLITFVLSFSSVFAQNDTMYIMKSGAILGQYNVNTEVDSIIFYNPAQGATTTVTDIDGNTYQTITIGSQTWMADNLKTTKYNDSSVIQLVIDNTTWSNLSSPGYCWYNNDSTTYAQIYGALYNWFTIETNKLCPTGWHVPSDDDWKTLEMELGMSKSNADNTGFRGTNEGSKMAGLTDIWDKGALKNDAEFDKSGLKVIPGGFRSGDISFHGIGTYGYYWSSSEDTEGGIWNRNINAEGTSVNRDIVQKQSGISIRCLKD